MWRRCRGHVRESFTHGVNLVGQLGMLLGEDGDGFFQFVGGGAPGSMFDHGSRSDQML